MINIYINSIYIYIYIYISEIKECEIKNVNLKSLSNLKSL